MAKIFRSSVINAPIDEVWARIRDFNALPDWHPAFTDSYIENDEPSDKCEFLNWSEWKTCWGKHTRLLLRKRRVYGHCL